MVRVRLFAALREIAGTGQLQVPGRTVGEVVDAVCSQYGERFAAVAGVSSFAVNGERADRSAVVADSDEVAILPPVSGGCGAGDGCRTDDRLTPAEPHLRYFRDP